MKEQSVMLNHIPAVLYGGEPDRVWLYVHGKQGRKEEAKPFAETVCPKGWQVLAVDLPEHGERKGSAGSAAG